MFQVEESWKKVSYGFYQDSSPLENRAADLQLDCKAKVGETSDVTDLEVGSLRSLPPEFHSAVA